MKIFLLCIILLSYNFSYAEVKHIKDKKYGLDAFLITLDKLSNTAFMVIDVPEKRKGDNIMTYWEKDKYSLIINGGYFDSKFKPVSYYKLKGKVINKNISRKFSGFVAIDQNGKISLLTKKDDFKKYPTVIQVGPYVIDPGGKIGIKSRNGKANKRTLIGITEEKKLVIIVTNSIQLYDLAFAVKSNFPKIERLLNLDGGPSTALVYKSEKVINIWPVRNYIVKKITDTKVKSNK